MFGGEVLPLNIQSGDDEKRSVQWEQKLSVPTEGSAANSSSREADSPLGRTDKRRKSCTHKCNINVRGFRIPNKVSRSAGIATLATRQS